MRKRKNMWPRVMGFFGLIAIGASSVDAAVVAGGCPAPKDGLPHTSFYVDPVHGSSSGDGSKSHPWRTLAEVLDVRSGLVAKAPATFIAGLGIVKPHENAPIKSGDTIYLMSGEHGSILLQGNFGTNSFLYGYNNPEFITIAAAPGQTPIIKRLSLKGVNKWIFEGITFQSLQDVPGNKGQPFSNKVAGLGDYFLATVTGPNSNVIFRNNVFQSQADTSTWTVNDWLYKRVSGIYTISGKCVALTNNRFQNIGFGIGSQRGSNILIQGNVINRFTDDGIDFGSSYMEIDHNQITNSIDDGDGFHRDAMQGQPYGDVPVVETDITNNFVANQTEKLVSPANLQGIDAFDGVWNRVRVENNVVITNAFHGITFYGVDDIWIINNTVIASSAPNTWININPSKSQRPSTGVSVRNNIASFFAINASGNVDHNMVATTNRSYISHFKTDSAVPSALYMDDVFQVYDPSTFRYDARLKTLRAVGTGGRAYALPYDIRGLQRGSRIDLGAFAYGGAPLVLQPYE